MYICIFSYCVSLLIDIVGCGGGNGGGGVKILKLHWLNHPKTVPRKQNHDQKINYSEPHIWSLSINFSFSGRQTRKQQKLAKNSTHFTIQYRSKNITHFTTLNSNANVCIFL